jgi:hypothetical protein
MADNNGGSGTTVLALIVGALVVLVVALFMFGGIPGMGSANKAPSVTITAPKS